MTDKSQMAGIERRAVVLLSGGLDSMVTAGLAREDGYGLYALTID
jgi:7-cyano-7-deazaguanine synthase